MEPADGVIMLNSPYGLFEPLNEKLQGWSSQQTREARLATLKGILEFICGRRHPVPALSSVALRNCQGYGAIGGPGWVGGLGCQTTIDGERLSFDERDNRGSVYLYFTPQDQTVGLANVRVSAGAALLSRSRGSRKDRAAAGFSPAHLHRTQAQWREGKDRRARPSPCLPSSAGRRETWEDTGLGGKDRFGRANFDQGDSVLLTAPRLPLPTEARFDFDGTVTAPGENSASGVYQVRDTLDPIDAAIGVSNGGWKEKDSGHAVAQQVDTALAYRYGRDTRSERALNEGKELARQTHVFSARDLGTGMVLVTRAETPYEARLRLQTAEGHLEPLSFHSAIPNNPEHNRRVLAYDLAIGAGDSVDDVVFYQYLCRVADWRLDWKAKDKGLNGQANDEIHIPSEEVQALYHAEEPKIAS